MTSLKNSRGNNPFHPQQNNYKKFKHSTGYCSPAWLDESIPRYFLCWVSAIISTAITMLFFHWLKIPRFCNLVRQLFSQTNVIEIKNLIVLWRHFYFVWHSFSHPLGSMWVYWQIHHIFTNKSIAEYFKGVFILAKTTERGICLTSVVLEISQSCNKAKIL